jgi:hypothetical protein
MTDEPPNEIPPYQGIDIVLANHRKASATPVAGWAITHPVLGAEMFEREEDADARISEIAWSSVKWPQRTSKFKAWIHTEGNRKHWSPR